MIYTYINQRGGESPIVDTYDTDSAKVKNLLNWIKEKIGATSWSIQASIHYYMGNLEGSHGTPGEVVAKHGVVHFAVTGGVETDYIDDGHIMSDLRGCMKNPEGTARDMIMFAMLLADISAIGKYEDPDLNKPAIKDWEVPGAPIGPEYQQTDILKGYFVHRGGGGKLGDKWTGPSGRVYQLEWKSFAFGGVVAWRGL